ncbi:flagellar motor switch protein FliN [Desulforudis sp. 1088]|uniref:flagellar motor switch protein FliN n=1 Tax=unclassified Candidatus Desulforudis TaxID=2635950 RepID=UPI003CE5261D
MSALSDEGTTVHKVSFPKLDSQTPAPKVKNSLRYLEDVKLSLWVELGRKTIRAGDILQLEEGSVIELEKAVGEAVSVYLNDQRFARGEVIVLDDSFAVRIHSILAPRAYQAGGAKK